MRNLKEKYGETAMVAGASEGIGAAFSEYLAKSGMNLVLLARHADMLTQLADRLRSLYAVEVTCIPCDLSDEQVVPFIKQSLNGKMIDIIVYNAAVSYIGAFVGNSFDQHETLIRVNMRTPVRMLHEWGAEMLKRERGAFILMSSLAGFQGSGFLSMYAASKAFNLVLAESLWFEWKRRGVDVLACCAGATATPNYLFTMPEETSVFAPRVQAPSEIPQTCFRYLGKKPSVIVGRGNRVASFFMHRLFPRSMSVTLMGKNTEKMYRHLIYKKKRQLDIESFCLFLLRKVMTSKYLELFQHPCRVVVFSNRCY
ncbi:MAG: SDR family NAD(P)-dependent oxidoreductase [Microbacter sp.]